MLETFDIWIYRDTVVTDGERAANRIVIVASGVPLPTLDGKTLHHIASGVSLEDGVHIQEVLDAKDGMSTDGVAHDGASKDGMSKDGTSLPHPVKGDLTDIATLAAILKARHQGRDALRTALRRLGMKGDSADRDSVMHIIAQHPHRAQIEFLAVSATLPLPKSHT